MSPALTLRGPSRGRLPEPCPQVSTAQSSWQLRLSAPSLHCYLDTLESWATAPCLGRRSGDLALYPGSHPVQVGQGLGPG